MAAVDDNPAFTTNVSSNHTTMWTALKTDRSTTAAMRTYLEANGLLYRSEAQAVERSNWALTAPITATGATAGTPGSFTPSGAAAPYNLAILQGNGVTASPATAWTTGQRVVLGDASLAHWTGTAWAAGAA